MPGFGDLLCARDAALAMPRSCTRATQARLSYPAHSKYPAACGGVLYSYSSHPLGLMSFMFLLSKSALSPSSRRCIDQR